MPGSLLQRIYWRILRAFGFEQLAWDKQFEAGVWCRGPRSAYTISRVAELCGGGRLVEFGCGEGSLPHLLPGGCFTEYFGYDISEVAIARARQRASAANLTNCRFARLDMAQWAGVPLVTLVVAEECLYYLTRVEIEVFLRRCCDYLVPDGSILIVVHSATKHASTLEVCRRVCRVIDETIVGSRTYLRLAASKE